MTSETKPASELAATQVEPGDTTNIPVTIPGMTHQEVFDAKQSQEQQKRFEEARASAQATFDAAKLAPVPMHRLFKSTMDTSYIFKNGDIGVFRNKRYLTNNPAQIAELEQEILIKKNPYLKIDPKEKEADPTLETPEAKMRAKLFAEWSEQLKRALNPEQDAGSTAQQKLTPQSTMGVKDIAAGGPLSDKMAGILAKIGGAKK